MRNIFSQGIALSFGFCLWAGAAAGETKGCPSVEQIIEKAVEKSKLTLAQTAQPEYTFTKVTEREEFDSEGKIKEHKSSSNEMFFKSGITSRKPIQSAEPNSVAGGDEKKSNSLKSDKPKSSNRADYLNLLTPDMLAKYVFTLVARTTVNGRTAFEVDFTPKKRSSSGKTVVDRILNQAAGKLWIDAAEFELARAQVHLDSEILFGGGILGSVKKAFFMLERTRLPDGIWFDQRTRTDYEARKLTESMRVIMKTESSGFRRRLREG